MKLDISTVIVMGLLQPSVFPLPLLYLFLGVLGELKIIFPSLNYVPSEATIRLQTGSIIFD